MEKNAKIQELTKPLKDEAIALDDLEVCLNPFPQKGETMILDPWGKGEDGLHFRVANVIHIMSNIGPDWLGKNSMVLIQIECLHRNHDGITSEPWEREESFGLVSKGDKCSRCGKIFNRYTEDKTLFAERSTQIGSESDNSTSEANTEEE